MPFCPECKYEYVEGIERCPDCDVELVPELPQEKEQEHMDEPMEPVFFTRSEMESVVIIGVLEEAGIPSMRKSDIVKWLDPFTRGPLGEEAIVVPASKVEDAKKAIAEAEESGALLLPENPDIDEADS